MVTGSFSNNTSTGHQSITGLGFQPSVILFYGNDKTADGTQGALLYTNIGIGVSSSSRRAVSYYDANGTNGGRHTDNECYTMRNNSTEILGIDLVTMDSGGFTVNIGTTNGTAYVVNYLALTSSEASNVYLTQITCPGGGGTQATTGAGFKPTALITLTAGSTSIPAANLSVCDLGLGFGTSSSSRVAIAKAPGRSKQVSTKIVSAVDTTGSTVCEADLTSLDSDGWTLNWTSVLNGMYVFVLALKGGQYAVGTTLEAASNTTSSVTGLAFKPTGLLLASQSLASGTGVSSPAAFSVGSGSGPSARGYVAHEDNNSTNSDENLDRTKIIGMRSGGNVNKGDADLTSLDSAGFTLTWTNTDGTQREILYFAVAAGLSTATSGMMYMFL